MLRNAKIDTLRIAQLTVAAIMAAAAPVCFTLAAPARAAVVDVQCAGSFDRSFSPAVTVTPQNVTVTEAFDYDTCAIGPSATGAASIEVSLGCVPVTAGPPETETVTWSDATGGTSTITWSAPTVVGQTAIFTGTVTAGRYAGDAATKVTSGVSYLGSVVGCLLGTPVSNTTGLVDSIVLTQ
ncbi:MULTISPECIES: hypothetical protein [Sorangium]|uniref:Secreted protein n=1 Tax=Sorangium cellulosum TaxID=56 RepID=A0A4P2QWM2_SORCE|nr:MULTISPECIES: hypothetical protein [Sorangium]AUX34869.1 uncharacterized protein SOCE836_070480 [Sorangium cellulosum]WCQ94176.1 hypothetical protein NQZ70_06933 [Sorangium sp. Soce836]